MVLDINASICFFLPTGYIRTLKSFQSNSNDWRLYLFIPSVILAPFIVLGNSLVLVSILRRQSLRMPSNLLISCLAFADFLVGLVFLPLYSAWTFSDYVIQSCSLSGLFLCCGWLLTSASFSTMIAVSFDRYIALFYHLKYRTIVSSKRVIRIIIALWIISAVISCASLFNSLDQVRFPVIGCCLATGLIVITFIYTRIFILVRRHQRSISAHQTSNTSSSLQRKLSITMAYVILVFIISYMPFGFSLITILINGGFTRKLLEVFHLSELLFCFSSLVNPVIYCLRNQEIQAAVVSLLQDIKRINLQTNSQTES